MKRISRSLGFFLASGESHCGISVDRISARRPPCSLFSACLYLPFTSQHNIGGVSKRLYRRASIDRVYSLNVETEIYHKQVQNWVKECLLERE